MVMEVNVGFGELLVGWDLVEGIIEEIENTCDKGISEMAYSHKDVIAMSFECLVKTMDTEVLEDSKAGNKYYKA